MRPQTPTINTSQVGIDVTSPPDTPTAGSPTFNRKIGSDPVGRPSVRDRRTPPNIPPLGGVGSQFNYTRGFRPEEISPRSSESSDEFSESSASPPQSPLSEAPELRATFTHIITTSTIVVEASFEIEECSDEDEDAMEGDDEGLDILQPDSCEDADSERCPSEVDTQLMNSFQDLKTCYSESEESDQSDFDDYDSYLKRIQSHRQEKKLRRMKSGSISKRTISERGSDSDREDLQPWDTGDPVQRRMRRKTDGWKADHRRSLLSNPTEIIIELKEPDSDWDDDEINLAQELPFYTIMEVDSD
ncbi:hypothetical protein BX600DRAFT_510846 [Xylariales sp. PMI_506]|nr:hypothetical protein BX600DRAFT_510846 [Xylariales sp. PMI_506]